MIIVEKLNIIDNDKVSVYQFGPSVYALEPKKKYKDIIQSTYLNAFMDIVPQKALYYFKEEYTQSKIGTPSTNKNEALESAVKAYVNEQLEEYEVDNGNL